jgi:hypothetical protein
MLKGASMPVHKLPELRQDALQLLQRLAEMRKEEYRNSYEFNAALLDGLGFPTEEALQEAVQSLYAHAHEYSGLW